MGEYTAVTAQRLKELRLERGISSPEKLKKVLEEQTGVSLSRDSLRGYEVQDPKSGKSNSCNDGMSAETLRTLAQFYRVSADYILGFDVPKSPVFEIGKFSQMTGIDEKTIEELIKTIGEKTLYSNSIANLVSFFISFVLSHLSIADFLNMAKEEATEDPLFFAGHSDDPVAKWEQEIHAEYYLNWLCRDLHDDMMKELLPEGGVYNGKHSGTPE